jgi:hypothetical protein
MTFTYEDHGAKSLHSPLAQIWWQNYFKGATPFYTLTMVKENGKVKNHFMAPPFCYHTQA